MRDLLVHLADLGGRVALEHFRRAIAVEWKPDRTPVTAADRAVEDAIRAEAARILPDVALLGEEHGAPTANRESLLAIDPIDGTSAFLSGLPTWAVSIGLLRKGKAVAGVIHLPALSETYSCDESRAYWNATLLENPTPEPGTPDAFLLAYSEYHRRFRVAFPGKVRSLGSTAYHMALVARGAALSALLGRAHLWDVAAGAALLAVTGGVLLGLDGAPVALEPLLQGQRMSRNPLAVAPGLDRDSALRFFVPRLPEGEKTESRS